MFDMRGIRDYNSAIGSTLCLEFIIERDQNSGNLGPFHAFIFRRKVLNQLRFFYCIRCITQQEQKKSFFLFIINSTMRSSPGSYWQDHTALKNCEHRLTRFQKDFEVDFLGEGNGKNVRLVGKGQTQIFEWIGVQSVAKTSSCPPCSLPHYLTAI